MEVPALLVKIHERRDALMQLVNSVDRARMTEPGVAGEWSVKDIVAHLTIWHQDHVLCLDAAVKEIPAPDPPWPLEITETDDINDWIFAQSRERMLGDVLKENKQVFEALMGIVKAFPADIQIERIEEYRVVQFGGQQFSVGYFFDHLHEDHEAEIQEWLAKRRA